MKVKLQTDGFVVVGVLPNEEHHRCLVCGKIPEDIHVDVFTPNKSDIPPSIATHVSTKTLALTYRLCPSCYKAKPDQWKLRLLLLERLEAMVEGE